LNCIISNILNNAPEIFETPKQGDSRNEYVDLRVARFIVGKEGHATLVNKPYASEILNILARTNFIKLIEQKTKLENLNILRMQLNCMDKNSFIGIHTDSEHDPAYKVTAVVRTASDYSGGELYLYGDIPKIINQKNHSIFLMDSNIEHEVKMVTNGYRHSLIVVLG
jgi:Rps23 Pro-64 3,4-dihydroxylase Tpa1-like proline 4-hydroxylase